MDTKVCRGTSPRTSWYFESPNTPTISMSGVCRIPCPIRRPTGLAPPQVLLHQRLVDQAQFARPAPVRPGQVASRLDRNAQGVEVTGRDGVEKAPRLIALLRLHARNRDARVPAPSRQQARRIRTYRFHSRHARQALQQRTEYLPLAPLVVEGRRTDAE